MIDVNSDDERQFEIENLEAISGDLNETLKDNVERRKNLSLRVSASRHDKYKALAELYKTEFDKGVPLGSIGDQLVDQLNQSLIDFLCAQMYTVFRAAIGLAKQGYTINAVTLECFKNGEVSSLHTIREAIEVLLKLEVKDRNLDDLIGWELSYEIHKLALKKVEKSLHKSRSHALRSFIGGHSLDQPTDIILGYNLWVGAGTDGLREADKIGKDVFRVGTKHLPEFKL